MRRAERSGVLRETSPERAPEKREGVISFHAHHEVRALPRALSERPLGLLLSWRTIFAQLGLIGREPDRYDGAGYGNLSVRVAPFPGERGRRSFLISGTQTGGSRCLKRSDFALVRAYRARSNEVWSEGQSYPSSESMTHGAVYDLSPAIRVVFHVHSPSIWNQRRGLRLLSTSDHIEYGTPAMAREVQALAQRGLLERGLFAMGGHEDGIISFGRNPAEAGQRLLEGLAQALAEESRGEGALCLGVLPGAPGAYLRER